MSLYKEFVAMVEEIQLVSDDIGVHDAVQTVPISKVHLFAVKDFVKAEIERRVKGGRNSAGVSGRKIIFTDEKHVKRREAMRRWREKRKSNTQEGVS